MRIVVDADSCPRDIREILYRAAEKNSLPLLFVSNGTLKKSHPSVTPVIVAPEEDSADKWIRENTTSRDLIITRDIPLAAELVERERTVINDRGDTFTRESIRERLSIRDMMKDFRDAGLAEKRGRNYGEKEKKRFADTFNRELTRLLRNA